MKYLLLLILLLPLNVSAYSDRSYAVQVEEHTNSLRQSLGIHTLEKDSCLTQAAIVKAKAAIDHPFSHGPDPFKYLDCPGDEYAFENIAWFYDFPFEAYVGFKDSTNGHREAMLDRQVTKIGVGTWYHLGEFPITVMYVSL